MATINITNRAVTVFAPVSIGAAETDLAFTFDETLRNSFGVVELRCDAAWTVATVASGPTYPIEANERFVLPASGTYYITAPGGAASLNVIYLP